MESSTEYSIMALDLKGVIVAWNKGAENFYNYSPSEIIGKCADPLYDPNELALGKVQSAFDTAFHKGAWSGVLQRVRKNGIHFNAFVTISPRRNIENKIIGYTLISRDLTDMENVLDILNWLKRSEAMLENKNVNLAKKLVELQTVDRLKSEFLANVSHELRTPLNGIIGFTELLYEGKINPGSLKQKDFLEEILDSARQLLGLINEILDLAQLETNKFSLNPVKVNLKEVINKIEVIFHSLIVKKNIHFKIDID